MKRPLLLLIPVLLICGCKKENDSAQWDVAVLAPLFKTTLGVNDLVPDSLTQVAPDGAVTLVLDTNIYTTPLDSLFRIEDTLQSTVYLSPGLLNLQPGFVFYSQPNDLDLNLNSVELKVAIVKSGFARLFAKNHLPTSVIYTFNIPKATLNGVPFQKIQTIAPAPSGSFIAVDTTFDLSGYAIDLTGTSGTDFNNLSYNVVGETATNGTSVMLQPGDTVVDVTSGFQALVPLYAKGYLGQGSFVGTGSNTLPTGMLEEGTILLDSISATFTFKNSVGAEAQALLTKMRAYNYSNGTTIDLIAPTLVNHVLNLNRATESGPPPSPVNSTYYSVQLDNTNSNIIALMESLPDKLEYDLNFNLNPLGNASGHNDFLYTDDLFEANLKINFPLRFAANQLLFTDTQALATIDTTGDNNLGDGTFKIIAENGFPYELELQLITLDENYVATDSLFIPNTIAPAPMDGNFRAVGKKRTEIIINLSEARREKLLQAKFVAIRARFSTSSYPQILQIYSDYVIDLKLVGDFIYHIR